MVDVDRQFSNIALRIPVRHVKMRDDASHTGLIEGKI